ncbi:MAG: DUF3175 domain-containing protein [Gluconacetobacter liquefaciens]
MSMLVFFINRAERSLSPEKCSILNRAKGELRRVFGAPWTDPACQICY